MTSKTTPAENPSSLREERLNKLKHLRQNHGVYHNTFTRSATADELQQQLASYDKPALEDLDHKASVAGRVMAKRGPFWVLQDASGRIQAYVDKNTLPETTLALFKQLDIGDIIGVIGPVHRSGKGDLYVLVQTATVLTKSLRPLPDKYHGLADQELRYRQRYLDLIVNDESKSIFMKRSHIISSIRNFLQSKDFIEVETPMMHPIPGGATARPFITHHNSLNMDMYLRVAPELYLKRLLVGGFERVFEINRSFRNEGLSTRHNPEFTMLEFYQAYADYRELMDLTEAMFAHVAQQVLGSTTVTHEYQDNTTNETIEISVDLTKPFTRLTMTEAICHYVSNVTPDTLSDIKQTQALCQSLQIKVDPTWSLGKLIFEVFDQTVESQLIQPTFITEYPIDVSPLAKRNEANPEVTDRFELFVAGRELANGFSELNDPEDQAERFRAQAAKKEAGDEEAMHFDHDYINALEVGMPPAAGQGIGIDRLVMWLTNTTSIRDVLLFPHMRSNHLGTND